MPRPVDTLSLNQLKLRLVLGVVALNLAGLTLGVYSLWRDRQQYEQRVAVATRNTAQLVAQDVDATFSRIDLMLHELADEVAERLTERTSDASRINAYLHRHQHHLPDVISLRMTDARGRVIYGNDVAPGVVDLSDRDFFKALRDNPEAAAVIGKPVRARISQVWSIPVARRVNRADGALSGVLYANLPVEHLVQKFSKLELGPAGVVVLRNLDYELLARFPVIRVAEAGLGQAAVSKELVGMLTAGLDHGTYESIAPTDRIRRTNTFYKLRQYPLYVVVGLAPGDYLDAWWRNVWETAALHAVMSLLSIGLAVLVYRGWRRQLVMTEAVRESEERLSMALDSGEFCVWDWDLPTGKVIFSKRGKQLFGYADDEIGDNIAAWEALVHPEDHDRVLERLGGMLRGEAARDQLIEYRVLHKNGSWMWVLTRGIVSARDAQGQARRLVGTHVDITPRRQREDELRMAATVWQMADEAVVVTDADNRIVSVNPAFTAITGYEASEVQGRNPSLLSARTHPPAFYHAMWDSLRKTGSWRGEVMNRRKNGEVYVEWLTIKRILDAQDRLTHHVAVFSDITARKEAEQRMRHLALHDGLTDLPNRALLTERVEQAILHAQRARSRLALLYFDLDRFKPVNDAHGHEVGDLLLRAVARRVVDCVRASDTVARVGGDEFVVLLTHVDGEHDALNVAEKIRQELEHPFPIAGHALGISCSIGVALYPEHGADESTLTRSADEAMYQAKAAGRGRAVLWRPPSAPASVMDA